MNSNQILALAVCLVIAVASSFLVSVYIGVIFIVITATLTMSFHIYNSAGKAIEKPILMLSIDDDGKTILLHNIGNRDAKDIKISLVPANIEFTIESVPGDSSTTYETGSLIGKNRAIVRFCDEEGKEYSHKQVLMFRDECECEYDPTKPMFDLFK
jgi:hypothetical protein